MDRIESKEDFRAILEFFHDDVRINHWLDKYDDVKYAKIVFDASEEDGLAALIDSYQQLEWIPNTYYAGIRNTQEATVILHIK